MYRVRQYLPRLVVLISILSLICFGILGIGRGGSPQNFDGIVLYAAGRTWLNGDNPYNHDELSRSVAGIKEISSLEGLGFFYPPQSSVICIFQALFSYPIAKNIWLICNLITIAAIAAMTVYTIKKYGYKNREKISTWLMISIVIGNPFTTHVIAMGQTSLVAVAATMAAWLFHRQHKWLIAGFCLGLASFKPQLSVLLILWFLLERNWQVLVAAFVGVCALSIYPMVVQGLIGTFLAWLEGLKSGYTDIIHNVPGQPGVIGLESLLAAAGIYVPWVKIFAVFFVVLLWIFRQKINQDDVLGILMGITLTFVGKAHPYDYVCLFPLLTSLWVYSHNSRRKLAFIIPLALLLIFPQRFVRMLGIPVLNHWRTVVIIILVLAVIWFSVKYKDKISQPNRYDDIERRDRQRKIPSSL